MGKQTNAPRDWRILAERDLNVAEHLANNMRPIPTEIIAYHCQQAVEKYLKGTLAVFDDDPPYTHELDELCSMVVRHNSSFAGISSLCTIITQFSIQPRYDLGLSLSEDDMHMVLAHTHTIKEFLQKEMPDLFKE